MIRLLLLSVFLVATSLINAQNARKTTVVADAITRKPVSFASVVAVGTKQGKTADINGVVSLTANDKARFQFSSVGYEAITLTFESIRDSVFLIANAKALEAVVVGPTDESDPRALAVIKQAIANKKINDPDALDFYSFTTYGKLYFDTLTKQAKSLFIKSKADSTAQATKPNYLFMIESIIDHQYKQPGLRSTNMVAQKVSGIKNPFVLGLATQLQYYSFYPSEFTLLGNKYYNPVSNAYKGLYVFRWIDSLQGDDGLYTYIISFRPKRNKYGVELMRGELHIHEKDFAIVNVNARATTGDENQIAFKQRYQLLNGKWFPEQLYTEIAFNPSNFGVATNDGGGGTLKAYNTTYLRNVNTLQPLSKSSFGNYNVTVAPDVDNKPDSFWNNKRAIPLSVAELTTYRFVDSALSEVKAEKAINGFLNFSKYIMQGFIPIKKVNLDLKRVIAYNDYEGLRLGVGLTTNERLMKHTRVSAYWGYGFGDKAMKYGGGIEQIVSAKNDIVVGASFSQDIALAGLNGFKPLPIPLGGLQRLFTNRADSVQKTEVYADFWLLKKFRSRLYVNYQDRAFTQGYQFALSEKPNAFVEALQVYETGLHIISSFKQGAIKLGNFFSFDRTQSKNFIDIDIRNGWLVHNGTQHQYQKAEVKYVRQLSLGRAGVLNTITAGGAINGYVPFSMLFGNLGSGGSRRTAGNVVVPATFQTMQAFEFTNDRYAALFTTYETGYLLQKTKKYGVVGVLANNIGWGDFSKAYLHNSLAATPMNQWYTETGAGLKFRSKSFNIGVLAMYRYGAYHLANEKDNWAFKILFD
ncbi:MAG TPA: hypothetical protein DCL43_10580 [Chitinophagaceae bacterium]|nr:hypothetical protein [Chitinophagaceae bacterium]